MTASHADETVIEQLAELEHQQWRHWRANVLTDHDGRIHPSSWSYYEYGDLPESVKEEDRVWARRAFEAVARAKEEEFKRILNKWHKLCLNENYHAEWVITCIKQELEARKNG